ncbi:MAG: hypothetical protein Q8O88_01370 [bacterium]|nr:hypothetical protein [bacterium]
MAITFGSIINTTTSLLNSNLTDPFNGTRTGSFFFNGDQELTFTRFMPKGQVTEDTETISNHGFGIPYERDEEYRINIHFFTKHNDVDPNTSLKNRALVVHYINLIKNVLIGSMASYGGFILEFDSIERPIYLQDQQMYLGTIPIIFRTRKTGTSS